MQAIQLVLPIFGQIDNTPVKTPKRPADRNDGPKKPAGSVNADGAQRQTLVAGKPVSYLFRRRRRKSIGFTIDQRGLIVSAPRWVPFAEVEDAVREKASWIARKTVEWQAFETRRASLDTHWGDGGQLRYLGQTIQIELNEQSRTTNLSDCAPLPTLSVPLARESPAENVQRVVEQWLREQAQQVLEEKITRYGSAMGMSPRQWSLSNARTQWGSCSADQVIRLNWRLINLPDQLIDYVVVHELAHLRELNHSPAFWAVVESAMPQYKQVRQMLNSMPEHLAL